MQQWRFAMRKLFHSALAGCGLAALTACGVASANSDLPSSPDNPGIKLVSGRDAVLSFHLECLGGRVGCDRAGYIKFWGARLGNVRLDDIVEDWSQALGSFDFIAPLRGSTTLWTRPELPISGPPPGSVFDGRWRFQQLLFSELTGQARKAAIRAFVGAEASDQLREVVARFEGVFDPWWADQQPALQAYKAEIAEILNGRLSEFNDELHRLFQIDGGPGQSLFLVPRPASDNPFRGSQKEDLSIVEVDPATDPTLRALVVLHELIHSYYGRSEVAQTAQHEALEQSNAADMGIAYGLTAEVLPTALANGIAAKLVMRPDDYARYADRAGSFYTDLAIDTAAKAAMSHLESQLETGRSADVDFFSGLHEIIIKALGRDLYQPRSAMTVATALYVDPGIENEVVQTVQAMGANSVYNHAWSLEKENDYLVANYPTVTIAVFGTRSEINQVISQSQVIGLKAQIADRQELPCVAITERGRAVYLVDSSSLAAFRSMSEVPVTCHVRGGSDAGESSLN